jgi:hypothetical protein
MTDRYDQEVELVDGTKKALRDVTEGEAFALLDHNTTDFNIYNRDWPRHGCRYEVIAINFFSHARGLGATFPEAVVRALRMCALYDSRVPRVTWEEAAALFPPTSDTSHD